MTLDLSFKELVDAAANPNAATGRPLLVAIDCIDEDPDQPRRNFSEQELEELSQSIGEHGVLQPIMLRRSNEDGRFVIVMGARRYRAALALCPRLAASALFRRSGRSGHRNLAQAPEHVGSNQQGRGRGCASGFGCLPSTPLSPVQ
jgi:hypothetical protein